MCKRSRTVKAKCLKENLVLPIFTVDQMGWRGIKNGQLLDHMDGTFTILVTTDKNLRFQQNLQQQMSLVILPTNRVPLVLVLMP